MARSKDKTLGLGRRKLIPKFPLRFLAHLSLLTIFCQNIPNASCQPLLNQLAVFLRPRLPYPTSFPSGSQQNHKMLMHSHQNHHQQQPQFIHQQGFPQHMQQYQMQNVYPTSSEQFQNFLASNNLAMQQGPLSQGIPMVSMDPAQNSITIMTPTGPEQIVPPNPSGSGGGMYVAQPMHSNDNVHNNINNNNNGNTSSNHITNPIIIDQSSMNGHNNNLGSSQTIVQVLPNHMALDNILDGNSMQLSGAPTGSGNYAVGGMPPNFPNEQHHLHQQQQQHQPSAGFQPSFHQQQGFHLMHSGNTNNNQQVLPPPPPPPPIPKNLKGPAIIAVPKPLPSQNPPFAAHSFFNSVDQNFQHFVNNPSGSQHQPVILQSIHHQQLPNMSPAFSQLQLNQQQPQQQLISSPENAMMSAVVNNNASANSDNLLQLQSTSASSESQASSQFSFSGSPLADKSPEIVGNPRNQRKRHPKKQPTQQPQQQRQQQEPTRAKIIRKRPTARPTQIPVPSATESYQNEIESKPSNLVSDYSLSTIINLPSTTITGSFEYPDPPTPPNFESMNALKYPSPFEDSAEVIVKDERLSSSQERLRLRDQKKLATSLNLHNGGGGGSKKRRVVSTPSSTIGTSAGAASSIYSSITSAASASSPIFRETTSFIPSTTTKKDKNRRKSKSDKAFRPSPQIHSFEEPVTGIKSYITILPPTTLSGDENSNETRERLGRGKKSLKFQAVESRHPPYEAGFKPVSQYTIAVGKGSVPAASTTTETLYFDLIREASSKAPGTAWSEPDLTAFSEDSKRQNRQFVTTSDGLTVTPVTNNGASNYGYTTLSSTSSTDSFIKAGWKVKDHGITIGDDGKRQLTTSASSDRVESWKYPEPSSGASDARIYFGNGKFGPPNCDKFHRFGFCPMNSGYPTDQVEKIASRCSALLSHLIAPLPKTDVRYDVIVAKNGSMLKGRSAAPSGWSWKNFAGKPVCDTKEIKVVPGWAKNEQGEWLVILQTKAWKQEAQITLCTPQGSHYNCNGNKGSGSKNCSPNRIKCVQRFTAQRLAVLDPENTDRCPVLRSVFLPSACVCLYDDSSSKSNSASSEELARSSSSSNSIANSAKTSKGSSKKGSKGKKGNKKSSSKSSSKGTSSARTARSKGNSGVVPSSSSSEEEQANKSDMLDTAADSSTSGAKAKPSAAPTFSEKKHSKNQEDENENENVSSPEEEATGSTSDGAQAKPLISTQPPTNAHTSPPSPNEVEENESGQNEVEDENADASNETGNNSTIAITTNTTDSDDDNTITTTVTSGDAVGDDESSASAEKDDEDGEEEKKE